MDKKELRAGNVVRCIHHLPIGFKVPLLIHATVTEVRDGMVGTSEGFYKYSDIAPIALDDSMLQKLGVKNISETEYIINKVGVKEPDVYLLKDMSEYYLSTEKGGKYSIPIESLHQLQNIYYILTGKDLVVDI